MLLIWTAVPRPADVAAPVAAVARVEPAAPSLAAAETLATPRPASPAPKAAAPGQKQAAAGQPADIGDICLLPDIARFAH